MTAKRHKNEHIHVMSSGFSFKNINENIDAIKGTRLIIINALATLVFARARIKATFEHIINRALSNPGLPIARK